MQLIMLPAASVVFTSRQRTMDDATTKHIHELAEDIRENGLLHAITITQNHELVAGYCRLHAVQILDKPYKYANSDVAAGFIPCVITHAQDEASLFRIELMENLRRRNLSPLDQAKAISRLHSLFQQTQGDTWSEAATGRELDAMQNVERNPQTSREEVSDSILISNFADDPEIQKAATRKEAAAIARKRMEKEFLGALGQVVVASRAPTNYVIEGSCFDILPAMVADSYSGIITDPPYGIGAHDFGDQTGVNKHEYEDNPTLARQIMSTILNHGMRICKENAHLYIFCSLSNFDWLREVSVDFLWNPFPSPLIWHKGTIGHAPWPGYFQRQYECIFFAQKGARKLSKVRGDVFQYPAVKDKLHAAEKPAELLKELLSLSFFPGEFVLDPCCGSGSIFPPAKALGIKAVGIEIDKEMVKIATGR